MPDTTEIPIETSRTSKITRTIFAAILIVIILFAVLWLKSGQAAADPPVTKHQLDKIIAEWGIHPYPALTLNENTFTIALTTANGDPIEDAQLSIVLEMINMVCADYSFQLTETEPGVYEGDGVPLMAGLWKATLSIEQTGQQVDTIIRTLKSIH